MGLLDDAIREHLDLKRRRGADPADVERAEREALGPVRRVAEGHDDDEPGIEFAEPVGEGYDFGAEFDFTAEPEFVPPPEFAAEPGLAAEVGDDSGWREPFPVHDEGAPPVSAHSVAPEPVHEHPVEPVADPAIEHSPEPPALAAALSASTAPGSEDRLFFEPDHEHEPSPEPAYEHAGGETVEYDVEHALESESAGDGAQEDDVLEETPEFLQDTPEHDRLWFEQKPPRDFDFDG